jgi:hypothetical protein
MLPGVGGPEFPPPTTVTTVEFDDDVTNPEALSVAVIVAVLPAAALAATERSPSTLTVATAEFEDAKVSPEAESTADEPSL